MIVTSALVLFLQDKESETWPDQSLTNWTVNENMSPTCLCNLLGCEILQLQIWTFQQWQHSFPLLSQMELVSSEMTRSETGHWTPGPGAWGHTEADGSLQTHTSDPGPRWPLHGSCWPAETGFWPIPCPASLRGWSSSDHCLHRHRPGPGCSQLQEQPPGVQVQEPGVCHRVWCHPNCTDSLQLLHCLLLPARREGWVCCLCLCSEMLLCN